MHRIRIQLCVAALAAALALPALAQQAKPQSLKMANVVPENSWFGRQHKWWVAEAEKRKDEAELSPDGALPFRPDLSPSRTSPTERRH